LLLELNKLEKDIGAALSTIAEDSPKNQPLDISMLRLESLKEALIHMDGKTINALMRKYSDLPPDSAGRERLEAIEECILLFEYEKAIEIIDDILSGGQL
jgi:hypothetical protein